MSAPEEPTGATSKSEGQNARVTVKISLKQKFGKDTLKSKYKVERYNLSEGYTMGPSLQALIPKGTPDFVEHGESYVERVMRALYHFKQCALIGPSGVGKSVCKGEEVFVTEGGGLKQTTVDSLFDNLSRRLPVSTDPDGWETIPLARYDIRVLSMDQSSGELSWRRPYAMARSYYEGNVLRITTKRNRSVTVTPDHSIITEQGPAAASRVVPGTSVPILRKIPELGSSPTTSVELMGFLPNGKLTESGVIAAPLAGVQIHSPELESIANSGIIWDPIKDVTESHYKGWVYDFQVPTTETFVAGFGGVVTHNTHVTYLVAELAGLPLWEINCGLQTSVYDLFGRFVGLGKENWVDGQIVSWCRYGGILYLDEANMMKQDIATRLNPLLDTRGHMVLNERDNEVIPRHPNGCVIISMNPYSAEFAGTKPLNAAFRRRMTVWIDFDYLSVGNKVASDEVELVARKAKVDSPTAEKLVRVAAEIRRQYKSGDLPYAPSPGDLINWATLVADGLNPARAAEETVIALTADDPEVQNSVRRIVRMVVGDMAGPK